jgi:hypothetical protein
VVDFLLTWGSIGLAWFFTYKSMKWAAKSAFREVLAELAQKQELRVPKKSEPAENIS